MTRFPAVDNWTCFAREAWFVGLAFFLVYPLCNWYASGLSSWHALYLDGELALPFLPEFIWFYLSMYVLFLLPPLFVRAGDMRRLRQTLVWGTLISGAAFVLFPSKLGFARVLPEDAFYAPIYAFLFGIDLPHNMVPSLHVVYSALIVLAIIEGRKSGPLVWSFVVWLGCICVSTLFVHQHHVLDVLAGLVLAWCVQVVFQGRNKNAQNVAGGISVVVCEPELGDRAGPGRS